MQVQKENQVQKEIENSQKEIFVCMFCGRVLTEEEIEFAREHQKEYLCEECLTNEYAICEVCEEYIHREFAVYIDDEDMIVCQDCFERDFVECVCCGWRMRPERAIFVEYEDNYVCQRCYEEHYTECYGCGRVMPREEMTYVADEDAWYCEDCLEDIATLMPYFYKPEKWIFRKYEDEDEPLYMGVELEVDTYGYAEVPPSQIVMNLEKILGDVVLFKRDGSLGFNGFEIVSHPCSLRYHKECIDWEKAFEYLKDYGYSSHDVGTCGLHVSVTKPDELEVAKIILFFEKHWDKVLKFSRRTREQYIQWCDRYFDDGEEITFDKIKGIVEYPYEKYRAINISKKDIMEIRIFRGTLNIKTFYATLEFVQNVLSYVKNKTVENLMYESWDDFVRWCIENGEVEYMLDYMKKRGLY